MKRMRGFTLVELMIVVTILGIIAAFAIPQYKNYVMRGQLAQATNGLSAVRAQMEQYYQDNRTYQAAGAYTPPCASNPVYGLFTITCEGSGNPGTTTYLLTATGSGVVASFVYTLDQSNDQATTSAARGWNTSTDCWVIKKGQTC